MAAKMLRAVPKIAAAVGVSGSVLYATSRDSACSADSLHPAAYPWSHNGMMAAYDAARWVP